MKVIFLGTPEFARDVLQGLIDSKHQVVAVVSQMDKPVGRKQKIEVTPTKLLAQKYDIPVFQFKKIRKDGVEILKSLGADVMVTVAYGQILSKELLELTKYGTINVHGSLLPKYRGAAPFQWALINGEEKTGVTIMRTDVGIDDGDMIVSESFDIESDDNVNNLYSKATPIAIKLLLKTLDDLEENKCVFIKQNNEEATYFPMLKKEIGYLDFSKSCDEIVNLIRGIELWPTACTELKDKKFYILKAKKVEIEEDICNFVNGEVVLVSGKKGIIVKANDGFISLLSVQLEGGKVIDGKAFANGNKIQKGDILHHIEN